MARGACPNSGRYNYRWLNELDVGGRTDPILKRFRFGLDFSLVGEQVEETNVEDAYRGRAFGTLGTSSSLLMFVGTLTAGAVGGILGPIALLNFQSGACVVAGVFVLLMLAQSRALLQDPVIGCGEVRLPPTRIKPARGLGNRCSIH